MATSEDVCNEIVKNSPENCVVKQEATENIGNEPSDLQHILEFLQKNNYKVRTKWSRNIAHVD